MTQLCPRCGRGISAKFRNTPHVKRLTRRQRRDMSAADRRAPRPVCPTVVR